MATVSAPPPYVPPCLIRAAQDYALPPRGMIALLITENGRPGTISRNTNGTADHGPFQINTVWINRLHSQFGVTPAMLTNDFCLSARAAAYIVRYEINLANGSFWDGIGHYHSRTRQFKDAYIQRVYRNSLRF